MSVPKGERLGLADSLIGRSQYLQRVYGNFLFSFRNVFCQMILRMKYKFTRRKIKGNHVRVVSLMNSIKRLSDRTES